MQSGSCGGAQSFRRERVRGSADAGRGGGGAGGAEGSGGAENGAHVTGVLDTGENDQEGSTRCGGCTDKVIESCLARFNKCGDTLRVLGIGETFEEAVCSFQSGKREFRPVNQGSETLVVAFTGFTEENGSDRATGAQSFLDETHALDADEAIFRGQTAAESHAELLEPAIVAAGEERGAIRGASAASGLAGRSHHRGG